MTSGHAMGRVFAFGLKWVASAAGLSDALHPIRYAPGETPLWEIHYKSNF